MAQVELSAGTVEYGDTGGTGPVLVLLPGLAMDGRLWQGVIEELPAECRCLTPTLPFGAHRQALSPTPTSPCAGSAGSSPSSSSASTCARSVLCFNDWGGAQTMVADGNAERVGRLVLVSCETAGNYPPGLAGHAAWLSCKLPGGLR